MFLHRVKLPGRSPLLLLFMLLGAATHAAEAEAKQLFNGHDLAGWDGDARFWSAVDGVIRGQTTLRALPIGNTFLIWRGGSLRDFELRVDFRIESGNSGVQYRARELRKWVVAGYQAEIENKLGKVGFLYEERGRKFLARVGEAVTLEPGGKRHVTRILARQEDLISRGYYRPKAWNTYRIVAKGNHLEHWLNGFKTIAATDNDKAARALEGLLALQIHAGPPMLVEFRDILLKEL